MNELKVHYPYAFIAEELAPSFEAMLGIAYKRLQRLEDRPNNGVDVTHLQDMQIFVGCVVRNTMTIEPDHPFTSKMLRDQIELAIEDAVTYYRRERFTIRTCDEWIIKAQREVW